MKYLSSIYLFVTNPSQHEGALHSARLRIISNKALLLNADSAGLPPFIQAKHFVAKFWQPPCFEVLPPVTGNTKERDEDGEQKDGEASVPAEGRDPTVFVPVTVAELNDEKSQEPVGSIDRVNMNTPIDSSVDGVGRLSKTPPNTERAVGVGEIRRPKDDSTPKEPGRAVPGTKQKRLLDEQGIHWLGDKVRSLELNSLF